MTPYLFPELTDEEVLHLLDLVEAVEHLPITEEDFLAIEISYE